MKTERQVQMSCTLNAYQCFNRNTTNNILRKAQSLQHIYYEIDYSSPKRLQIHTIFECKMADFNETLFICENNSKKFEAYKRIVKGRCHWGLVSGRHIFAINQICIHCLSV